MQISESTEKKAVEALLLLVRQSGIALVFAVVVGWALSRVYADLERRNESLVELVRSGVSESRAVAISLQTFADRLERIERRADGSK